MPESWKASSQPSVAAAGFTFIPVILLAAALLLAGIYFLGPTSNKEQIINKTKPFISSLQGCKEETVFKHAPVNLEKTRVVVPLGLMSGGHVTPIDHQYFQDFQNTEADIEVYSPGKGTITEIQFMSGVRRDRGQEIEWNDYRVEIDHGCGISSTYIHITELADKVAAEAPKEPGHVRVNIPVTAGEVIGWYQNNVDYNLVDESITLSGFVVPEHYEREPWKVHVPDTLEYFTESIVDTIIAKSLRSTEPYAGKFDWDIDGKLRGNWFQEGTDYYAGSGEDNYWEGHLSISPDYLDHNHTIISMGNYEGREAQYAVKENSPNPADVGSETGLVKYELVGHDYITTEGKRWDRESFAKIERIETYGQVHGVVLVEMLEDRKLKFEAFPGKTADQVSGLTLNAKIYVR